MKYEVNIDLSELRLFIKSYFLSFHHTNILIKALTIKYFPNYEKSDYDEFLRALRIF